MEKHFMRGCDRDRAPAHKLEETVGGGSLVKSQLESNDIRMPGLLEGQQPGE